jgi:hypothetical protein
MLYSCNTHKYGKVQLINKGFLNTNTVMMQQLMRTARMLEAEWRQVLWGSMSTGAKEDESSTGRIWLLDFTMLWPVLASWAFWNLWTTYFFNFPIFFWAAVNCGYWISGYGGTPVCDCKSCFQNKHMLYSYVTNTFFGKIRFFVSWL